MSNISGRIIPVPSGPAEGDIQLNAFIFSTGVLAYLLGDATAAQVRDHINAHITEHGGAVLTSAEENDVVTMKSTYDGLTAHQKHEYRDKLIAYTQSLQDGFVTEAWWDGIVGL